MKQMRFWLLIAVLLGVCSSHCSAQAFTGMIKPIDCTDYTGTTADFRSSYSTLYRDRYTDTSNTYYEGIGRHPGVDIDRLSNGTGNNSAPIKAVYDGTVVKVYRQEVNRGDGWGNCLVIQHDGIPSVGTVYSSYGHMSRFEGSYANGSHVNKGQIIGYVGQTGNATGPHLHFQIDKVYSDYGGGLHPYFPPGGNVNIPDTDNAVLNHTYNPMKFVQDHSTPETSINLYVDGGSNGNDLNNGSSGSPFNTLAKALEQVSLGTPKTIYCQPGYTYFALNGRVPPRCTIRRWGGSGNVIIKKL